MAEGDNDDVVVVILNGGNGGCINAIPAASSRRRRRSLQRISRWDNKNNNNNNNATIREEASPAHEEDGSSADDGTTRRADTETATTKGKNKNSNKTTWRRGRAAILLLSAPMLLIQMFRAASTATTMAAQQQQQQGGGNSGRGGGGSTVAGGGVVVGGAADGPHQSGRDGGGGSSSSNNGNNNNNNNILSSPPGGTEGRERRQQREGRRRETMFPRWDDPRGISFEALLEFAEARLSRNATTVPPPAAASSSSIGVTASFRRKYEFPETLYVIRADGVWTSRALRELNPRIMLRARLEPTESLMVRAHRILIRQPAMEGEEGDADGGGTTRTRWPRLRQVLSVSASANAGVGGSSDDLGIPFFAWYGDFKGCNLKNWHRPVPTSATNGTAPTTATAASARFLSIPLFTTCARIVDNCNYSFPIPTYKVISETAPSSKQFLRDYPAKYPWRRKKRQVVWRGSLSGALRNFTGPRTRLGLFAGQLNERRRVGGGRVDGGPDDDSRLFDVGLTSVPPHNAGKVNISKLGGLVQPIRPMSEFQNYQAVLDSDGNSWSSRFATLLCYNSVVLKVAPRYVDYFHYDQVRPYEHYVPVKYDLSDLVDRAKWVLDETNEAEVKAIVQRANDWCRERMELDSLARDLLDIWERYVQYLDRGGVDWSERFQTKMHPMLFGGNGNELSSGYRMAKLNEKPPMKQRRKTEKL